MKPILDESKTLRLLLKFDDDKADEICAYNDVIDHIQTQLEEEANQDEISWKFRSIKDHKGPLQPSDPENKCSKFNVLVE